MTAGGAVAGVDGAGTSLLTVRNLDVRYGRGHGATHAVRQLSLDIAAGEVVGLVGESGSGKSSVCAAITRLLPPGAAVHAESIVFEGTELTGLTAKQMRRLHGRRIALIPQRPMTSLSATTPIGRQLRWYLGDHVDQPQTCELLTGIGLGGVLDRLDDLPGQFSGGQLQRLLIAITALAHRPALLIADEPTMTLDATVQAEVLRELLAMRDRVGSAILFVSHDLSVVARLADRVGVMYGGRLVELTPTAELFASPRHPYTAALLAAMPEAWQRDRPLTPIPGSAAGANRLPGCPFAPRCARAQERCFDEMPAPEITGRHLLRCFYPEPADG